MSTDTIFFSAMGRKSYRITLEPGSYSFVGMLRRNCRKTHRHPNVVFCFDHPAGTSIRWTDADNGRGIMRMSSNHCLVLKRCKHGEGHLEVLPEDGPTVIRLIPTTPSSLTMQIVRASADQLRTVSESLIEARWVRGVRM